MELTNPLGFFVKYSSVRSMCMCLILYIKYKRHKDFSKRSKHFNFIINNELNKDVHNTIHPSFSILIKRLLIAFCYLSFKSPNG